MLISKIDFFQDESFGWSGLGTFIFSNIIILLSFGLSLAWGFYSVRKMAVEAVSKIHHSDIILVPGLSLQQNKPTDEFKCRLQRAANIFHQSTLQPAPMIIVLGGLIGNNTLSEAAAGADYLINAGVAQAQILLEDKSRHTLENMSQAVSIIGRQPAVIITSRYHLLRCLTLARGLGMQVQPVAAEDSFNSDGLIIRLMLKEAYYLHWYWSGRLWSLLR